MPAGQDALIEALAKINQHVAVVLETGGPVAMPWKDQVAGIAEAWYPGSNGGQAIARVLAGDVDAQGRLPVTFPVDVAQLPRPAIPGLVERTNAKGAVTYGLDYSLKTFDVDYITEGANVGYRWFDHQGLIPLYPFGYGLSYGRVTYDELKADAGHGISASFRVKNVGRRPVIDTPQVYAIVPGHDGRPVRRLVGWSRLSLSPGQLQDVTVKIDPRMLANFDVGQQKWHVAAGKYRLILAKSAGDTEASVDVELQDLMVAP